MKPEVFFGINAGKVWEILKKNKKDLGAKSIAKETKLSIEEVYGALGWLGREGKIEVINRGRAKTFKLLE